MELPTSSSVRGAITTTSPNDDKIASESPSLTCQFGTGELDLSSSITSNLSDPQSPAHSDYSTSPTKLSKFNSRLSRQLSARSCNSVRAIGTIPIGQLVVSPEQQQSNSDEAEKSSTQRLGKITEERRLRVANPSTTCLDNGDVFRLLELPKNFIVGHDDLALMITEARDDGFRDIPPGPHFLWVQLLSSQQQDQERQADDQHGPAPRCGYWYVTKQTGQIRAKQWDKYNEILGDVASQCEADELRANIDAIYPTLRPYKLQNERRHGKGLSPGLANRLEPVPATPASSLWHQLTWAISEPFLERVTGKRNVNEWLVDSSDCVKGDSQLPFYHQTATRAYKAAVSSELRFLFSEDFADLSLLDLHTSHDPAPADTTNRVLALLNDPSAQVSERDIIAELQFTYVTGTQLGNAACLEQWWELVLKIVFRSWQLVGFRPELCLNLLRVFFAQLYHTTNHTQNPDPNDRSRDSDGLSNDKPIFSTHLKYKRKLRLLLAVYRRRLLEALANIPRPHTPDQDEVTRTFEDIEAWCWKYKWSIRHDVIEGDEDDEFGPSEDDDGDDDGDDDDDLPVVVDLDENGRERGLVSFDKD